jgi:hypothetical protein
MGDKVTTFNLRSKLLNAKGHIPSHFGIAAIITACSFPVIASIGMVSISKGHSTYINWGIVQIITSPPPAPLPSKTDTPQTEPPKNWSERQKDVPPAVEQVAPVKAADDIQPDDVKTVVTDRPHEISSSQRRTKSAGLVRRAKRDWGTFRLEVPAQGDSDLDEHERSGHSYMRNGVTFHLHTVKCDPHGMMPLVCYLPKGTPRPIVRGW